MDKPGRKSAADLAVVESGVLDIIQRPDPPEELTHDQAIEWVAVVNRMAADWFPREVHGMLVAYCRHVVAARKVAQLVNAIESGSELALNDYDQLLKMQEREGRALSAHATRLRITTQSTKDKRTPKGGTTVTPWD